MAGLRRKLVYLLYRAALWAGLPFILLYAAVRIRRDRRYLATLRERLGWLPPAFRQTAPGAIWLHAVSVGEAIAAATLLRRLRDLYPGTPLFVSVSTLAGRDVAESRLAGLATGVFYAPVDYVSAVRRVLRTLRPALLIVMETEIWPNLWREARRSGARLLVVNARISDKAWPRYRRLRALFAPVLGQADAILAQSAVAGTRFRELGAPPERVIDGGNLKYDFAARPMPVSLAALLDRVRPPHVWIAASTMPPAYPGDCDENAAVIAAFHELAPRFPGLLLVLAPRKPETFDGVAALLDRAGLRWLRRSTLDTTSPVLALPAVVLLDSMGELSALFAAATAVFMGGTLAERGGHNLLEPAFYGKAQVCGPHIENFAEIADEFRAAPAMLEIRNAAELAPAVARLLEDSALRASLGDRALRLARSHSGAADRAAAEAIRLAELAEPVLPRALPARLAFDALSRLWAFGSRWKQRRDLAGMRRLPVPVISIGGLAMGGAGKTPLTLWLAARLRERGIAPAFLTRGYRRRSSEPVIVARPAADLPSIVTGDEAQLLLRSAIGPVGIGADRYAAGLAMLEQFPADAVLLDDGFQHRRLARDLDVVVLDALDPLAGGLFPVGRLRESPEALARAGAVVVNRARTGRDYPGIAAVVRRYNPSAPIFFARTIPREWIALDSGEAWPASTPPFDEAVAFCGLGNPSAFWTTLEALAVPVCERIAFPDHHRYSPEDLQRLSRRRAPALIATEKDAMNLPASAVSIAAPARIFVLRIGIEIEDASRFVDLVASRLTSRAAHAG